MKNITTSDYLLIIDGSSLLTTQFYGNLPKEIIFAKTTEEKEVFYNRIMQTSDGIYTNAVYGFIRVLLKILNQQSPSHLAVTWDVSRDTFRRELYAEYKGNRGETLEPLRQQFITCQELLRAMQIPQFMDARYEADDFSGTLSKKFENQLPVRIMTKDNDYLQLITENTNIWMIHSTSQKTEELYQKYQLSQKRLNLPDRTFPMDAEILKAEFMIEPDSVPSLKGLQGDASDNIKGVPGVGEVTAQILISHYKTIENLYDAIRSLDEAGKKQMNAFWKDTLHLKRSPMNYLLKESDTELVGERAAFLSRKLAEIKTDIALPELALDQLKVQIHTEKTGEAFQKLEFQSLKLPEDGWQSAESNPFNPFDGEENITAAESVFGQETVFVPSDSAETTDIVFTPFCEVSFLHIRDAGTLTGVIEKILQEYRNKSEGCLSYFAFSFYHDCDTIYGVGFSGSEKESYYISFEEDLTLEAFLIICRRLQNEGIIIVCWQLKKNLPYLLSFGTGSTIWNAKNCFDAELAAYLLNPVKGSFLLSDVYTEYLDLQYQNQVSDMEGGLQGMPPASARLMYPEVCAKLPAYESMAVYRLALCLHQKLQEQNMHSLYYEIEMPLVFTLYRMEQYGIKADRKQLKAYGNQLEAGILDLEKTIHAFTGEQFNINSPKQLGVVLFEKMKLPNGKKTKTGYSTSADVLEKIADQHPVIGKILEYRQLAKLKSTYADGLASFIREDERIHSSFNQTVTATGRLSSTEPNLQNIPIRLALGKQIRKVFIPEDGYVFLDADYSQIELRILAHMSGDEQLISAYNQNQDIHRATASQVFHVPFSEVPQELRSKAKAVNFGIIYGISAFGLGQGLNISRQEADEYIRKYFETYPRVKAFLEELIQNGRDNGYVTTLFGRRRPVPDLHHKNHQIRSAEERIAMNAPIQGTAADIIKIAMIRVEERFQKENMKSRLILQVHDELLVEARLEERAKAAEILQEEMENAASLKIRLEIEIHEGINWYEAK